MITRTMDVDTPVNLTKQRFVGDHTILIIKLGSWCFAFFNVTEMPCFDWIHVYTCVFLLAVDGHSVSILH